MRARARVCAIYVRLDGTVDVQMDGWLDTYIRHQLAVPRGNLPLYQKIMSERRIVKVPDATDLNSGTLRNY